MAITTQPPVLGVLTLQDLLYQITEPNGYLNFATIEIDGTVLEKNGETVVVESHAQDSGANKIFDYDIGDTINDYLIEQQGALASIFQNLSTVTHQINADAGASVLVNFNLQVLNVVNSVQVSQTSGTPTASNVVQVIKARSRADNPTQNLDDYVGTSKKFLTRTPSHSVSIDDAAFLSYVGDPSIDNIQIEARKANGTGFVVRVPVTSQDRKVHTLGIGPRQLIGSAGSLVHVSGIIDLNSMVSYTVQMVDATNAPPDPRSEAAQFYIASKCSGIRLFWENSLGGIDNITLVGASVSNIPTSEGYTKPILSSVFAEFTEGKLDVTEIKAYSAIIEGTDEEMDWLRDLQVSKIVYTEIQDGTKHKYFPVLIEDINIPLQQPGIGIHQATLIFQTAKLTY